MRAEIDPENFAQLLQNEIHHYSTHVRANLALIYRVLLLTPTVASALATVLFGYEQYVILLLIPFVGLAGMLVGISLLLDLFTLAAHKVFMEEQLNEVLTKSLPAGLRSEAFVPWDHAGGYVSRWSLAYAAIQGCCVLVLGGASAISISVAWVNLEDLWWLAPLSLTGSCVLGVVVILSYTQALGAYDRTLTLLRTSQSSTGIENLGGE